MRSPGKWRVSISIRSGVQIAAVTTLRNSIFPTSGTSVAMEIAETSFHQDLNGDGIVFTSPAAEACWEQATS